MGVSGHRHTSAAFTPRERPGTHYTGGWLGPRAGLGNYRNRLLVFTEYEADFLTVQSCLGDTRVAVRV